MDIGGRRSRGRHYSHLCGLTLALLLMAGTASAQDAGLFRTDAYIGIERTSRMTWLLRYDRLVDSLRNVSLFVDTQGLTDTLNLGITRGPTIKRDTASLAALADQMYPRSAAGTNDFIVYRLYGSLGTNASDSVNLQVGVNGVYEAILPNFDVYAFSFAMIATTPSTQVTTFRQDLLPMRTGSDSLYFFRVSRNVSMTDVCAITIYKVPASAGPDINDKTAGTFYDMVRFSGSKLTNAANRFFTVDVALKRKQ